MTEALSTLCQLNGRQRYTDWPFPRPRLTEGWGQQGDSRNAFPYSTTILAAGAELTHAAAFGGALATICLLPHGSLIACVLRAIDSPIPT